MRVRLTAPRRNSPRTQLRKMMVGVVAGHPCQAGQGFNRSICWKKKAETEDERALIQSELFLLHCRTESWRRANTSGVRAHMTDRACFSITAGHTARFFSAFPAETDIPALNSCLSSSFLSSLWLCILATQPLRFSPGFTRCCRQRSAALRSLIEAVNWWIWSDSLFLIGVTEAYSYVRTQPASVRFRMMKWYFSTNLLSSILF